MNLSKPIRASFDVIAIAASAGGIPPLITILSALPADFPTPVLVVQHLSPHVRSYLPEVLGCRTRLGVKFAVHGERLRQGMVYVARPNLHLLMTSKAVVKLSRSAKVCFTRPAADPLFLSLALCYKQRVIAVVLSGNGRDAAKGMQAIAGAGGVTIIQERSTCLFDGMPTAALETGCIRFGLSAARIAGALMSLTGLDAGPLGTPFSLQRN